MPPMVPAPLIRVPAGTRVRLVVRNTLKKGEIDIVDDFATRLPLNVILDVLDLRNPFRVDLANNFAGRAVTFYFDPVDLPDARFRQVRDSARVVLGARGELPGAWADLWAEGRPFARP